MRGKAGAGVKKREGGTQRHGDTEGRKREGGKEERQDGGTGEKEGPRLGGAGLEEGMVRDYSKKEESLR